MVGVVGVPRPVARVSSRRPIDELFAVLADPTRRDVLERLVHSGPLTATELAAGHHVTRQAIVKHLRALADAELVASEREGREVRYRATTAPLADAVSWLLATSEAWDRRAARLRRVTGSDR
jgi:DNA-binding transcriptional ArsR family regulator